ncbi:Ctr copper transporter family-domain-containing protein [Geopyxis carbonaria]|nr:Ctr copper transporter family-domain-containing protein [Geopyxis carbonaria]
MADFTLHSDTTTSSSSSSDSMSGMSHSSSSGGSGMSMIFFTSTSTPLFATAWTPHSLGGYVGTCIFLILLGAISRGLHAWKAVLERRWAAAVPARIVVAAVTVTDKNDDDDGDGDSVKKGEGKAQKAARARSWRWSSDLPRAALVTVNSGVGYLLMLAVMTMNVGYFMSVLAGLFVGELATGFLH